jgi:protein tyrosine/serine phosphatase
MSGYDLSTPAGRFRARWDYVWKDHAFLRRWFMHAHWLGPDLVRTNQPSPRQLAYWKSTGIRTVINLRGARDEAYYALEKDACERLGSQVKQRGVERVRRRQVFTRV